MNRLEQAVEKMARRATAARGETGFDAMCNLRRRAPSNATWTGSVNISRIACTRKRGSSSNDKIIGEAARKGEAHRGAPVGLYPQAASGQWFVPLHPQLPWDQLAVLLLG